MAELNGVSFVIPCFNEASAIEKAIRELREVLEKAVDAFMDVLRDSALFAPTFNKKLKRMHDRDFSNPKFTLRHLRKDLRLIMSEMKQTSMEIPFLERLDRLLSEGLNQGLGSQDFAALYNTIHPEKD